MAITTYAELQTAIAAWIAHESDTDITGNVTDFIALLESRLNRWQPPLRVAEVDTTLTGTAGLRTLALPADFREPISLHRTTGSGYVPMVPFIPGTIAYDTVNGTPGGWGINGTNIDLGTPEGQADTFTLRYRQKFALSVATPTNWLLTNHPDAYLFGSLVEALAFLEEPSSASAWHSRFENAMSEITDQESRSKSLVPLRVDDALVGAGYWDIYSGGGSGSGETPIII